MQPVSVVIPDKGVVCQAGAQHIFNADICVATGVFAGQQVYRNTAAVTVIRICIVAGSTVKQVNTRLITQVVIVVAASQRVIPGPTVQPVGSIVALKAIVASFAFDTVDATISKQPVIAIGRM